MYSLSSLLQSLPHIQQYRLVGSGHAVWVSWAGQANSSVNHTFTDYGGILMAEERNQSLWFFSTSEAFRAVARLQVWSRLNATPLLIQILPGSFLVGLDLSLSMSVSLELSGQQANPGNEFAVWVHPKLREVVEAIPGLDLHAGTPPTGFSTGVQWKLFHADQGLDYETNLSWFFIIKPLGKMGDKESVLGWREFFSEIQTLLQRLDLKYISDVREGHVIFPLANFRLLRTWCQEMLALVRAVKDDPKREYWPCVMAAVPQKGLTFTPELPRKVGLDWNRMAPDFPHLQYRDAFPLAEWFQINEVRYGAEQESLETWCNLALKAGEGQDHGTLDVPLPRKLSQNGAMECFYCGLKCHQAQACPTRSLDKSHAEVWERLARVNMNDLVGGLRALDAALDGERLNQSLAKLLDGGQKLENDLARALFEINSPGQLRLLQLVWRSRGKEWPSGLTQLATDEVPYVYAALEAVRKGDLDDAENQLKQASLKYMRSFQPPSLLGFVAMERGDLHQAAFYWQEAERLSYTPLQQGYFLYLQARALEIQGECKEAATLYRQAGTSSPSWIDPVYREAVCLVKMGFTSQAMDILDKLIDQDSNVFNRILIDPELERGRMQILGSLWDKWHEAETRSAEEKALVTRLSSEIAQRFEDNHDYFEPAQERLERMRKLTEISNYVAYSELVRGLDAFTRDLNIQVESEIKRIKARMEAAYSRLKDIQREAAWFPFPKLLRDFNRDFNFCVEKMNWIRNQPLTVAENFRSGLRFLNEIDERISQLQKRLVTLRIVRDGSLFVLMLGRAFIWLEIIGLGLALVTIPALIYSSRYLAHNWLVSLILDQKWEFQKGLVIILSVLALGLAAVRTAFGFEKRKKQLFERKEQELQERARARRAALLAKGKASASRSAPPKKGAPAKAGAGRGK